MHALRRWQLAQWTQLLQGPTHAFFTKERNAHVTHVSFTPFTTAIVVLVAPERLDSCMLDCLLLPDSIPARQSAIQICIACGHAHCAVTAVGVTAACGVLRLSQRAAQSAGPPQLVSSCQHAWQPPGHYSKTSGSDSAAVLS